MPQHAETRFMPHPPDTLFALVADIARYPEFLPWCAGARIRKREVLTEFEQIEADLMISFKVFREKFGSRVRLFQGENRIETEYLDGPFKHMHSVWRFAPAEGGTQVSFETDFEFRSKLLQSAIALFFDQAMQQVVGAFEKRAAELAR